jgi:hypothetical protein
MSACMVCGEDTDRGPTLGGKFRPLCESHLWGWSGARGPGFAVPVAGELRRADQQTQPGGRHGAPEQARAFMDWLTRVRAERRNGSSPPGSAP